MYAVLGHDYKKFKKVLEGAREEESKGENEHFTTKNGQNSYLEFREKFGSEVVSARAVSLTALVQLAALYLCISPNYYWHTAQKPPATRHYPSQTVCKIYKSS